MKQTKETALAIVNSVIENRNKLGQRNDNVRSSQLAKGDILTFNSDSIQSANYEQYKYTVFVSGDFQITEKHLIAKGNGIPLQETGYNERLAEVANLIVNGLTLKVNDIKKQINRFGEGYDPFYKFEVVATNTAIETETTETIATATERNNRKATN